ncbi:hypothetical protein [Streptomyces sp. NPDC029526]|uniref:hypothetical protein n=1 Tax=Streptomyces sp. NPDC029526 TaxID=3155728 RepID=UPI0033D2B3DC
MLKPLLLTFTPSTKAIQKRNLSEPAKWAYHGFGGAANFIPVVGDAVQRGADAAAYAWQQDEEERIEGKRELDNRSNFSVRVEQLNEFCAEWARANPDHELALEGDWRSLQGEIGNSAFNGNDTANRVAGITPK